ncbi:MAG: hypothetical protein C4542_05565 [Dehalococcoidia bacterium]|nr:MAG: hypothetical protein C4542_05565 [Dehalococcoidia bacterium]
MRQFHLINVCMDAQGKTVKATICDRDFGLFDALELCPAGVAVLGKDVEYGPVVRFPVRKLVAGNILDLDR